MSNKILVHPEFEKAAKRLAKKYRSFNQDIGRLIEELKENALLGTSLGRNLRKIRLSIKSKAAGKRGGGRVITYVVVRESTVFLLTVYDKSDLENISDVDLDRLLDEVENDIS
jgi:mRNA-degrading endonuclease RelE of RelBE toxin-antitoxin system